MYPSGESGVDLIDAKFDVSGYADRRRRWVGCDVELVTVLAKPRKVDGAPDGLPADP